MRQIAKFNGFTCDSCGHVVAVDERVRKVVTYHRAVDGSSDSYEADLCGQCAPDPQEAAGQMRPVKKRKSKTHPE